MTSWREALRAKPRLHPPSAGTHPAPGSSEDPDQPLRVLPRVATDVGEDGVEIRHGLVQLIVQRLVAEQFAGGALPRVERLDQRVGAASDADELAVQRRVAQQPARGAVAG